MSITDDDLEPVYRKIDRIKRAPQLLCMHPNRIPVSIDDLKIAVAEIFDIEIGLYAVDVPTPLYVRGATERYRSGRGAKIFICENQPVEMSRFVAAKELCHVALDEEAEWSVDAGGRVTSMIQDAADRLVGQGTVPTLSLRSEYLAELAAIEVLYPFEFREDDLFKLKNSGLKLRQLVAEYKIPEFAISRALDEVASSRRMWRRLRPL